MRYRMEIVAKAPSRPAQTRLRFGLVCVGKAEHLRPLTRCTTAGGALTGTSLGNGLRPNMTERGKLFLVIISAVAAALAVGLSDWGHGHIPQIRLLVASPSGIGTD